MLWKNWPATLQIVVHKEIFTFTDATIKDLPEIMAIEQASFSTPWSEGSLAGELSDPLSCTIIAKSPCKTIAYGYICCKVVPPEAELLRIAVNPEFRRRGVARSLLNEIFRVLPLQEVTELHLEVSEINHKAIALYKKMGFLLCGRRPGYYGDGATAALLLQRTF